MAVNQCSVLGGGNIQQHNLSLSLNQYLLQGSYQDILSSALARVLVGNNSDEAHNNLSYGNYNEDWNAFISGRAHSLLTHSSQDNFNEVRGDIFVIGIAAFNAFLQANVTGPPLTWAVAKSILPSDCWRDAKRSWILRKQMLSSLNVDGVAFYQMTPDVELFYLAKCILNHDDVIANDIHMIWARLRVNFWHQRMLNENSSSLQKLIYDDLQNLEHLIKMETNDVKAQFSLERASIHVRHGFDKKAQEDIKAAAETRGFEYRLTGRLGKRTKFQEDELSQLVVLAKSADDGLAVGEVSTDQPASGIEETKSVSHPKNINLNDDTLLDNIHFSKQTVESSTNQDEEVLPLSLSSLDPAEQPVLQPLDSIILLATASSITNTSPQDGLTREETLPYASRVLAGGSTNWQIYTQALLVRSRIEGYRSRTMERGLLQLQAVVDQVIAETLPNSSVKMSDSNDSPSSNPSPSFLPKPKSPESAPVSERLLYIHQLASPTRWELEAELASRWISLGGFRTALEIYERLQMWAEVGLCWAASGREDEARKVIRRQLYDDSAVGQQNPNLLNMSERDPLPADSPRLFCILGDLENSPSSYQRAWAISEKRYSRAQRSLGSYYLKKKDFRKADEAFVKSLKISPQNHGTWFALGSIRLQMDNWTGAIDAFRSAIQIDEQDAESWSNLAAAMVKLDQGFSPKSDLAGEIENNSNEIDDDGKEKSLFGFQRPIQQAFVALKHAASLKRDSYKIWQNLLVVSAKVYPPPYTDMIIAQGRLIDLRGKVEGEKCVDVQIVQRLIKALYNSDYSSIQHKDSPDVAISQLEAVSPNAFGAIPRGFPGMVMRLLQDKIAPLITKSRFLWRLVAVAATRFHQYPKAVEAYEKAWRITINERGWETGIEQAKDAWSEVVDATVELADTYEDLSVIRPPPALGQPRLSSSEWIFKAKSAVRLVLGRAKDGWELSEGYATLLQKLKNIKSRS